MRRMIAMIPVPVRVAVGVVMLAAAANLFLCVKLLEGGVPTEGPRGYSLESHGTKVRALSEEEFHQYQAYEVRLFSSAWLIFALVAIVTIRYVAPRANELVTEPTQKADAR
jgi:hypothetical protein